MNRVAEAGEVEYASRTCDRCEHWINRPRSPPELKMKYCELLYHKCASFPIYEFVVDMGRVGGCSWYRESEGERLGCKKEDDFI